MCLYYFTQWVLSGSYQRIYLKLYNISGITSSISKTNTYNQIYNDDYVLFERVGFQKTYKIVTFAITIEHIHVLFKLLFVLNKYRDYKSKKLLFSLLLLLFLLLLFFSFFLIMPCFSSASSSILLYCSSSFSLLISKLHSVNCLELAKLKKYISKKS